MRQHPINYLNGHPGYIGETWNPALGCAKDMPCAPRCWARRMAARWAGGGNTELAHAARASLTPDRSGWSGEVVAWVDRLWRPKHWRQPRCIAVQFMGDISVLPQGYAEQVWDVIRQNPRHRYLLLTKQPIKLYTLRPPPQCWIGATVMTPADYSRITTIKHVPAAVRWVSFEPWSTDILMARLLLEGIDWIVIGAGRGYPQLRHDYAETLLSYAHSCGCKVWVKQLNDADGRITDDLRDFPPALRVRELPEILSGQGPKEKP